jgi:hypothetical protein
MRAYDVTTEDGCVTVLIFASSTDQAAGLFCDHHIVELGRHPSAFTVNRRLLKHEKNRMALRLAMQQNKDGLGVMSAGRWRIVAIGPADMPPSGAQP